ncbi:MAG TPA: NusG domain II-containing protein [Clostridiaceae bacterium]|nr:NusG domain II-containing protein [Clostridiaceae bacterium]
MQLKPRAGDYVIIAAIIITAVLMAFLFLENDSIEKVAVITHNNTVLDTVRLDRVNDRYTLNYQGEYPGTIEAENGRIRFSHAECPDQVCVRTGWISRPGQIAVCLPAGIIVKIEGNVTDEDIDIIVR